MAKLTGPLMSLEASGGFADTLVFGKWKGRNVVRQLVTPSNPDTDGQREARNKMTVASKIAAWVKRTASKQTSKQAADITLMRDRSPSGQAWNGYLGSLVVGVGQANYSEATAAWTALTAKAAWDTAAAALVPAYAPVTLKSIGNQTPVTVSPGEQFFRHQYALYKAGINAAAPGATPTEYA